MRIVLDSNVLLRAIITPGGPANAAYQLVTPPHVLLSSFFLLADVRDALRYPHVRRRHPLDDASIDGLILKIYSESEYIILPPPSSIPAISRDRDDDLIIATAVEGRADVLCTLDKDIHDPPVIQYCQSHGVAVLTDTQLLVRLRAGTNP